MVMAALEISVPGLLLVLVTMAVSFTVPVFAVVVRPLTWMTTLAPAARLPMSSVRTPPLITAPGVDVYKRQVHGEAVVAEEVSGYYVADEIQMTHRGMMIAIPEDEWVVFHDLTPVELADVLVRLARSVSLPDVYKRQRMTRFEYLCGGNVFDLGPALLFGLRLLRAARVLAQLRK